MSYRTTRRDRFVRAVCNWLLNHVATKEYRAFVGLTSMWGQDKVNEWVAAGAPVDGRGSTETEGGE